MRPDTAQLEQSRLLVRRRGGEFCEASPMAFKMEETC